MESGYMDMLSTKLPSLIKWPLKTSRGCFGLILTLNPNRIGLANVAGSFASLNITSYLLSTLHNQLE